MSKVGWKIVRGGNVKGESPTLAEKPGDYWCVLSTRATLLYAKRSNPAVNMNIVVYWFIILSWANISENTALYITDIRTANERKSAEVGDRSMSLASNL